MKTTAIDTAINRTRATFYEVRNPVYIPHKKLITFEMWFVNNATKFVSFKILIRGLNPDNFYYSKSDIPSLFYPVKSLNDLIELKIKGIDKVSELLYNVIQDRKTTTTEDRTMIKTSYDLHYTADGVGTTIASLSNDHLRNIINLHLSKMIDLQNQINQASTPLDAMSRAILGKLSENQLMQIQNNFLHAWQTLTVYMFEYVLRGLEFDLTLKIQLEAATGRKAAIALPNPNRTLESSKTVNTEVVYDDIDSTII